MGREGKRTPCASLATIRFPRPTKGRQHAHTSSRGLHHQVSGQGTSSDGCDGVWPCAALRLGRLADCVHAPITCCAKAGRMASERSNGSFKGSGRRHQEGGIESSDEAAWLNDKGKVQWDTEEPRKVPIWEEHRVW